MPTEAANTARKPGLIKHKEVWLVDDRQDGRSAWTRVGTAYEKSDGSWTIRLSALPVSGGRMNIRDPGRRVDERNAK